MKRNARNGTAVAASVPNGAIPVEIGPRNDVATKHIVPGSGRTEWFVDAPGCPEMVVIPPGQFIMGSPPHEEGQSEREVPRHEVRIEQPFCLGRFAVTWTEFLKFVEATDHGMAPAMITGEDGHWRLRNDRNFRNPFKSPQLFGEPAVGLRWTDCVAYVEWLTETTGHAYRLPSEAEWEYAARAGTDTPFWWGHSITPNLANYDGNHRYGNAASAKLEKIKKWNIFRERAVTVDFFTANPWGLYQVHGNVQEWCADCWRDDYNDAPSDGCAVTTEHPVPQYYGSRVRRGGSWSDPPYALRSAFRRWGYADRVSNDTGLRVARSIGPTRFW